MIMRFEDLVGETEETCKKICNFIGENYDPEMLTLQGAPKYQKNKGNSSFEKIEPGVISKKPVGRYKTVLSPAEIAFVQFFTGRLLKNFDYPVENNHFSLSEKMKNNLPFFPKQLLRMLRWLASSTISMNYPRVPENRFNRKVLSPINHSEVT